ncbi:TIGR03943 family putative permease subunit [Paenibacillus piri]|uniref:TIGR03943 family protein n=1 Tax=Paenibacillus piri TaxID=2547395 RepID=A0A4R5K934_9BACL|nr:TIGR03943 family protein [Paenibacillus piri]TDF88359.1 TIGR03943 family protein [Paenibacillus piri]
MATNNYASVAHHFLKVAILLGFAGYLIYLVFTGEILLFIAPHLLKYVKTAAAGLFIFAVFQLYISIRSFKQPVAGCACAHHHDHSQGGHPDHTHMHDHGQSDSGPVLKHVLGYSLFILPLLLAVLLPNQVVAGSLAKNSGIQLGEEAVDSNGVPMDLALLKGSIDPEARALFTTDKYNRDYAKLGMLLYKQDMVEMKDQWFIEKLQALNLFADHFSGKPIQMKGFIYRENGLPENQFLIERMAMTHCIADISPYGMIAELPDASRYANDTWVTLTGTIDKTTYHDQTVIKIIVQHIEPATAPVIPYVYPDWDFAKKLN